MKGNNQLYVSTYIPHTGMRDLTGTVAPTSDTVRLISATSVGRLREGGNSTALFGSILEENKIALLQ